MAKKKNVVQSAKGMTAGALILAAAAGWLASGYILMSENEEKKQAALLEPVEAFLADQLYVRAAECYKEALSAYQTPKNLEYEVKLLEIYEQGGMEAEYFDLFEDRMEAGTASVEEYRKAAEREIADESYRDALEILKAGIAQHQDQGLIEMEEPIRYRYKESVIEYADMKFQPAGSWIPAWNGEKWGYIDSDETITAEFKFDEALPFSNGYAVVKQDGLYTLIDEQAYWNEVDKTGIDRISAYANERMVGFEGTACSIYEKDFTKASEEVYQNAYLSDNGLIVVQKDGSWQVLNKRLKAVSEQTFADVKINSRGQVYVDEHAVAADAGGYYLINKKGEACFEARFADAKGYEGGWIAVSDGSGKWGFADETGALVIPCQYEDAYSFSDTVGAVQVDGKWGYISQYNTMVIEPVYDVASPFSGGQAFVKNSLGEYQILKFRYYDNF